MQKSACHWQTAICNDHFLFPGSSVVNLSLEPSDPASICPIAFDDPQPQRQRHGENAQRDHVRPDEQRDSE